MDFHKLSTHWTIFLHVNLYIHNYSISQTHAYSITLLRCKQKMLRNTGLLINGNSFLNLSTWPFSYPAVTSEAGQTALTALSQTLKVPLMMGGGNVWKVLVENEKLSSFRGTVEVQEMLVWRKLGMCFKNILVFHHCGAIVVSWPCVLKISWYFTASYN